MTDQTKLKHVSGQFTADFKSFHRSLCERFGFYHDEAAWQQDQESLVEHIAAQFSHVNAENAALRRQVETLQRGAGKLQEESEALRKDAERYRFLRQQTATDGEHTNGICIDLWDGGTGFEVTLDEADTAVDAAMSKGGQP